MESEEIGVDQKIRTALGTAKGETVEIQDWKVNRKETSGSCSLWKALSILWSTFIVVFERLLERLLGSQAELLRVEIASFEDMEIDIARIPPSVFSTLGINDGEHILIETPKGRVSVRALGISKELWVKRESYRKSKHGRYVDGRLLLGLGRMEGAKAEGSDISSIFIDETMRDQLGIHPSDAVHVSRHALSAFKSRILVLMTPVVFLSVTRVFDDTTTVVRFLSILAIVVFLAVWAIVIDLRSKVD